MRLFGEEIAKDELLKHVSSMKQIVDAKLVTFEEGRAKGLRAVQVNAGDGLMFTVLLDRGMDIGDASYKGVPIAWSSKVGMANPEYFENQGHQWLRNFYGGLLTTCGLIQVGEPCEDNGVFHGLHGRISHTPCERFWIDEYWEGDDYIVKVTGRMREAIIYGENIVMTREIKCVLGQPKILITDTVENEGYLESPFMIMYHVNEPYPIASEKSKVYSSADSVDNLVTCDQPGAKDFSSVTPPLHDYKYETFAHNMPMDRNRVYMAVINNDKQLGVYLGYNANVLPIGNQWKMLAEQEYVVAMEPANTYPVGIKEAREKGFLKTIKPKEKQVIELEIGVLDGKEQITMFKGLL